MKTLEEITKDFAFAPEENLLALEISNELLEEKGATTHGYNKVVAEANKEIQEPNKENNLIYTNEEEDKMR